jgi:hypothetical protein
MNKRTTTKRFNKGQEKAKTLRKTYWPDVDDSNLWNRSRSKGYTTIPRTLPQIMHIIDVLTNGKPAGQTYFVLWCRMYDESILVIENPMTLAAEAGYSGERSLSTWKDRMRSLQELGFIDAKDGPSGAFHYVLVLNPYMVIRRLQPRIQDRLFRQLQERAIDIGAKDMVDPAPSETDASD